MKHLVFPVALLVTGSAILLSACSGPQNSTENNDAAIITRTVRNMEALESTNGKSERIMRAPLMEEHALANPAYTEYTRGVDMIGFDSLGVNRASNIVADYAIFWSANELWELKGNVLAEGENARRLYTQQLFYNVRTGKVWSNVDCKFEMGEDVFVGVGFDAKVDLSYAAIRDMTGYGYMDVGSEESDGTPEDEAAADSVAVATTPSATPTGSGSPAASASPAASDVATAPPVRSTMSSDAPAGADEKAAPSSREVRSDIKQPGL